MATAKKRMAKATIQRSDPELQLRAREQQHRRTLHAERRIRRYVQQIERAIKARKAVEIALATRIAIDHGYSLTERGQSRAVNE